MGILEDAFERREGGYRISNPGPGVPMHAEVSSTPEPTHRKKELREAKITARGGIFAAALAAIGLLVGSVYTSENGKEIQINTIEAQREEREHLRRVEQEEELESINCGDVFQREYHRAEDDPEFVVWALAVDEESLLTAEEREACPNYDVLFRELNEITKSRP